MSSKKYKKNLTLYSILEYIKIVNSEDLQKIRISGLIKEYNHSLGLTLSEIERIAKKYKSDTDLFKDLSLEELFYLVSKKINYEKDPENFEFIMRPLRLLQRRSGDCDDKSVFILSWFYNTWPSKNIDGFGYSLVSQNKNKPFHHIFTFIIKNNKILDYDATYDYNKPFISKQWAKRQNKILLRK